MSENTTEIPEAVEALLSLFKGKLSEVVFPDVSLDVLEKLVIGVKDSGKAVEDAMKLVDVAQEALAAAQDELQQKCSKALAYARIYAEDQDELLEELSAIQFGKAVRATKKAAPPRTKKEQPVKPAEDEGGTPA